MSDPVVVNTQAIANALGLSVTQQTSGDPLVRILLAIKGYLDAGSGGGSTNYESLSNRPAIDGTTLTKLSTAALLGLETVVAAGLNTDLTTTAVSSKVAAINELVSAIADEIRARQNADSALGSRMDRQEGLGGALTAHDFDSQTPSLAVLLEYYCTAVWGGYDADAGSFTFDANDPAQSVYEIDNVTHTAAELFNNTWVRNTNGDTNHRWVLTNTPDTTPPVFTITDVGQDTVGQATDELAGVAKLYNALGAENTDGAPTQAAVEQAVSGLSADITNLEFQGPIAAESGGGTFAALDGQVLHAPAAKGGAPQLKPESAYQRVLNAGDISGTVPDVTSFKTLLAWIDDHEVTATIRVDGGSLGWTYGIPELEGRDLWLHANDGAVTLRPAGEPFALYLGAVSRGGDAVWQRVVSPLLGHTLIAKHYGTIAAGESTPAAGVAIKLGNANRRFYFGTVALECPVTGAGVVSAVRFDFHVLFSAGQGWLHWGVTPYYNRTDTALALCAYRDAAGDIWLWVPFPEPDTMTRHRLVKASVVMTNDGMIDQDPLQNIVWQQPEFQYLSAAPDYADQTAPWTIAADGPPVLDTSTGFADLPAAAWALLKSRLSQTPQTVYLSEHAVAAMDSGTLPDTRALRLSVELWCPHPYYVIARATILLLNQDTTGRGTVYQGFWADDSGMAVWQGWKKLTP
jgi:hypothetical protein